MAGRFDKFISPPEAIRWKPGHGPAPVPLDVLVAARVAEELAVEGQGEERAVHRVADANEGRMRAVADAAFAAGRVALVKDHGDWKGASALVRKSFERLMPAAILATMADAGEVALTEMGAHWRAAEEDRALAKKPVEMRFDASSRRAAKWAKAHAMELAQGVAEQTAEDLREAIAEGLGEGGDWEDARQAIMDAVGDSTRVELIARTEAMFAANAGQREGWLQAREEGLLGENATRVWIATGDACPECDELDGRTAKLGEAYFGGSDGPPLHPNCRCTEGIGEPE